MSEVENGWINNGSCLGNLANSSWFGFRVYKWDGNLNYIGMYINSNRFGYFESYNVEGSIVPDLTGFYLNDRMI